MIRSLTHIVALGLALALAPAAFAHEAPEGDLVTIHSAHDVTATIDRLEEAVTGAGATVFARVDHQAGAEGVNLDLRPTTLLIFGNPNVGTLAMQEAQTMGVDLPMRVVAWEDASGATHVTYTDPAAMAARHGIAADSEAVKKMTDALKKLTGTAAAE